LTNESTYFYLFKNTSIHSKLLYLLSLNKNSSNKILYISHFKQSSDDIVIPDVIQQTLNSIIDSTNLNIDYTNSYCLIQIKQAFLQLNLLQFMIVKCLFTCSLHINTLFNLLSVIDTLLHHNIISIQSNYLSINFKFFNDNKFTKLILV